MDDSDLDYLDAELERRADSLWSAVTGDAEMFAHLRVVLSDLRAEARRGAFLKPDSAPSDHSSLTLPGIPHRLVPQQKSVN